MYVLYVCIMYVCMYEVAITVSCEFLNLSDLLIILHVCNILY